MTQRISDADLALTARILADLLASGLPVARALRILTDLVPDSVRVHLPRLEQLVQGGASLSTSLANLNGAVPPLFIALVRTGEMGTGLSAALNSAASLYESTAGARSGLIAALTYPAFLLVVCVGAVSLLIAVVLPRFASLLSDLGQSVPASTALLITTGESVRAWAPIAAPSMMAAGALFAYAVGTPVGGRTLHGALLGLPGVGDWRHAWASASICATAGALTTAGVTLTAALQHASVACADPVITERILSARQAVLAGARPSKALAETRALTRVSVQLVRAGEESGTLPTMLLRAAELERNRAMRMLQTTLRLIEPTLVIAFGALVAFIATALLQAVYSIRPGT